MRVQDTHKTAGVALIAQVPMHFWFPLISSIPGNKNSWEVLKYFPIGSFSLLGLLVIW